MKVKTIEVYDVPTMRAANFNKPGGVMEVRYHTVEAGLAPSVQVVQTMPNPASNNLPWIEIGNANMLLSDFDAMIRPTLARLGVTLVKTFDLEPRN